MAAQHDIIKHRLERVGVGKEKLLNLLMFTDSYHDFKSERGKVGTDSCVKYIDKFMLADAGNLPAGLTNSGDNSDAARRTAVIKYYNDLGILFSKIEKYTRMYFEKELPKILYGTPENGTIPTVVTYTDFVGILKGKCDNANVISLERDYIHQITPNNQKEAKDKTVGIELLNWLFKNDTPNTTIKQVSFSFDAKASLIDELMAPLNNNTYIEDSNEYYALHLITPQNILDSAGTSYNVLPGTITGTGGERSRLEFSHYLTEEYANHLTKDKGKFEIAKNGYSETNRYGFQWTYTPNGKGAINISSDSKHNGPSITFLANMALKCSVNDKNRPLCLSKLANERHNATMANPRDVLSTLETDDFIKLCIDIKRLGDHEQANAVYATAKATNKPCVFVTGDTLSALYSRILGNPTMYVSTPGGGGEEEGGSNSAILCYRGEKASITAKEQATRDLEYCLDSINYILCVYGQFVELAGTSALTDLRNNIEENINEFQYKDTALVPALSQLMTNMIKWRAYDILTQIKYIESTFAASKTIIEPILRGFENTTNIVRDKGYNIATIVVNLATVEAIIKLTDTLKVGLASIKSEIDKANKILKNFNAVKAFDEAGKTIFTFNYNFFLTKEKVAETIPFLNFNVSDIRAIIMNLSRLQHGKVLRSSTDEQIRSSLSNGFYAYLSKFYVVNESIIDGNSNLVNHINKILSDTKNFTIVSNITTLIDTLNTTVLESIKALKLYDPASKKTTDVRNITEVFSGEVLTTENKPGPAAKMKAKIGDVANAPPPPRTSSRLLTRVRRRGGRRTGQTQLQTHGYPESSMNTYSRMKLPHLTHGYPESSMNTYSRMKLQPASRNVNARTYTRKRMSKQPINVPMKNQIKNYQVVVTNQPVEQNDPQFVVSNGRNTAPLNGANEPQNVVPNVRNTVPLNGTNVVVPNVRNTAPVNGANEPQFVVPNVRNTAPVNGANEPTGFMNSEIDLSPIAHDAIIGSENAQRSDDIPNYELIFKTVIDMVTPLFTDPEYKGMFTIVTGDKAIYTQGPYMNKNSNETVAKLVHGNEDPVSDENEDPAGGSYQDGGEIIKDGSGFYRSDYYYSHQFYKVLRSLDDIKDLWKNYKVMTQKDIDAAKAASKKAQTKVITGTEETFIAKKAHNDQIIADIIDVWMNMDAELTILGSPDFSIEPGIEYTKQAYNDIRRNKAYQTICACMDRVLNENLPDTVVDPSGKTVEEVEAESMDIKTEIIRFFAAECSNGDLYKEPRGTFQSKQDELTIDKKIDGLLVILANIVENMDTSIKGAIKLAHDGTKYKEKCIKTPTGIIKCLRTVRNTAWWAFGYNTKIAIAERNISLYVNAYVSSQLLAKAKSIAAEQVNLIDITILREKIDKADFYLNEVFRLFNILTVRPFTVRPAKDLAYALRQIEELARDGLTLDPTNAYMTAIIGIVYVRVVGRETRLSELAMGITAIPVAGSKVYDALTTKKAGKTPSDLLSSEYNKTYKPLLDAVSELEGEVQGAKNTQLPPIPPLPPIAEGGSRKRFNKTRSKKTKKQTRKRYTRKY